MPPLPQSGACYFPSVCLQVVLCSHCAARGGGQMFLSTQVCLHKGQFWGKPRCRGRKPLLTLKRVNSKRVYFKTALFSIISTSFNCNLNRNLVFPAHSSSSAPLRMTAVTAAGREAAPEPLALHLPTVSDNSVENPLERGNPPSREETVLYSSLLHEKGDRVAKGVSLHRFIFPAGWALMCLPI